MRRAAISGCGARVASNASNVHLGRRARRACLVLACISAVAWASGPAPSAEAGTILAAGFESGSEGFTYADDTFRGTSRPAYAAGAYQSGGGHLGGGLQVTLGGIDNAAVSGMSGGWSASFQLPSATEGVEVTFRYRLTQTAFYEYDESSEVLLAVDGVLRGRGGRDRVDRISGDGSSTQGRSNTYEPTTDWQQARLYVGALAAGSHTLTVGAYNSAKNASDESTVLAIDDVEVSSGAGAPDGSRQALLEQASLARYKSTIQALSAMGDRCRMSGCAPYSSYFTAQAWVADELEAMGYSPQIVGFTYGGFTGSNLWATKVGSTDPDEMVIVSAHLDGRGGGGAADDDGSGVALVLEIARVLSSPNVETGKSVRFVFWDNEESGLYGAYGYVQDRRALQGIESPAGSGLYPEPRWLGVIQHDMVLYDHGVGTPGGSQSAHADMDVEWRQGSAQESDSRALAQTWRFLAGEHALKYPGNSYDWSTNTDDTPFHPYVASVSVRENRRALTSGSNAEWINPYYHTSSDIASNYSSADYDLGYDTLLTTFAAVAELAGATEPMALPFVDDFEADRGWIIDSLGTDGARRGAWLRADPEPTFDAGAKQLGDTPSGLFDLVTGASAGRNPGQFDLDGGVTSVRSPLLSLPADREITLSFAYTFAHDRRSSPEDFLRLSVVGNSTNVVFEAQGGNDDVDAVWTQGQARLDDFAGQTVYLRIEAADGGRENLVEAAVDDVSVIASESVSPLFEAEFDTGTDGFTYADDVFRSTAQPGYASGARASSGGLDGAGGLSVALGGVDDEIVEGMSGGWSRGFTLAAASVVTVTLWVNLTQTPDYEAEEWSEALLSVDGVLRGEWPNDYIAQVVGNGNGGILETTGWVSFTAELGELASGSHVLTVGGYNNRKSFSNEATEVLVDRIRVDAR